MLRRNATRIGLALLVGAGVLLAGIPASATTKSLIRVQYTERSSSNGGFGWTGTYYGNLNYFQAGTGTATIGTGPTPSVMWPAGIATGGTYYKYVRTPSGTRASAFLTLGSQFSNDKATLSKGHAPAGTSQTFMTPGASGTTPGGTGSMTGTGPALGPTVMGSTFNAVTQQTGTTHCFTRNPPAGNPNGLPGSCVTRGGIMSRVPGPKKYGGTARMLWGRIAAGQFTGAQAGTFLFNQNLGIYLKGGTPGCPATPRPLACAIGSYRTGPTYPGHVGNRATGSYINLPSLFTNKIGNQRSVNPFTTGMASVRAAVSGSLYFDTSIALTGSHNTGYPLTPTVYGYQSVSGMISLVQPSMFQAFARTGPVFLGQTFPSIGSIIKVQVTFLPEPSSLLLLGCGALGLAGLHWLRKR